MPSPYDSSSSGTGSPTGYIFDSPGNPRAASSSAAGNHLGVAGSARRPATHGSRTMILDPTETYEEPTDPIVGVLELTGEPSTGRRVQWDEEVVDNEHMGKKKSKICCIFKKQKEFGESSDESSSESDSDSGSESDGGPSTSRGGSGSGGYKDHDESCNHHHGHGSRKKTGKPKKRVLNEYERMPKEDYWSDFPSILEEKTSTVIFDSGPFLRQYGHNGATEENHLEVRYEVKMECHQFLEHRRSPDSVDSSDRPLQQVRVENGRLPMEVRFFLGGSRTEVEVPQGVVEQCMLGLKDALSETIQRFEGLEPSENGTQAAMIYFASNALPSIDPDVPHSILLFLRLEIILNAECPPHLFALCPPPPTPAITGHEEAQELLFEPLMATLAHTMLTQDYPLVFSAAKIKHFVWVLEWAQVTAHSLYNVYRRASCSREKARMSGYIQTLQSRYPTIPFDDVQLLLEHVFTCHAYSEALGRRYHRGASKRKSALAMDPSSGADPVEPAVLRDLDEFRELDEDEETAFGEIKDSDEDDFWHEACELEDDMEDMAEVWAGLDFPDEKDGGGGGGGEAAGG
ncbi:Type 1 phosphatases regulator ypi1 [Podila minutissima]|uniref:Type 1 phosphatases regulator n=1 Tax=Podila minutissima TaxID=64525 RepID=A0A9P5SFY1_9FUNG|nr:Type 1 phosphatases regulator ypi1 [Podila minutissima]